MAALGVVYGNAQDPRDEVSKEAPRVVPEAFLLDIAPQQFHAGAEHGNNAYSNLNEGYGKVLRYGAYAPEVLEKLHWMNDVLAPMLANALAELGGIDMRALIAEALHMGDDCHNRCKAASVLYAKTMAPAITATAEDRAVAAEVLTFLGDNALSVLNPVMAACKRNEANRP